MEEEKTIEEILDMIGDQKARDVLAEISRESQSAKELSERLELSRATVYRRIEMLKEHELVSERTLVGDDGNHYHIYESNFNSTVISLDDDEYDVRIFREENLPDHFSNLWDELSR